jgi:hypothetical protein
MLKGQKADQQCAASGTEMLAQAAARSSMQIIDGEFLNNAGKRAQSRILVRSSSSDVRRFSFDFQRLLLFL